MIEGLGLARRVDDVAERDTTLAPPGTIDAHVHIFPERVFRAVHRWFDTHAWQNRYRFDAEQVDEFLAARGVERYLGLHYAHVPGMAESLNEFALDFASRHPRCIPVATVLPGEDDAEGILDRALGGGARAVKIHCHVQCVAPDDARMDAVFDAVQRHDALLVIHCGSAPAFAGYACAVESLCTTAAFARAMERHPEAKVCVPHLGLSDIDGYVALLERFPSLYLDTSMALSGYFPLDPGPEFVERHWARLLYGTDLPHIPHAWDRDYLAIHRARLTPHQRSAVMGDTARRLLRV